jgi:hypothetical protein
MGDFLWVSYIAYSCHKNTLVTDLQYRQTIQIKKSCNLGLSILYYAFMFLLIMKYVPFRYKT